MRVTSKKIRQAILVTEGTVQEDPLPEYFAFFKEDGTQVTLESLVGPAGPQGMKWQGTWEPAKAYLPQDAVEYNGEAYITLKPVDAGGATPDTPFGLFPGTGRATLPLNNDGVTQGTLTNADLDTDGRNADYYRFVVGFGGTVTLGMRAFGNFDAQIWLYNAAGVQVAFDDDGGPVGYDSEFTNINLGAGTYFLKASTHGAVQGLGAYEIYLNPGTAVLGEDGATWQLFAKKGAAGAAGAPGAAGAAGAAGPAGPAGPAGAGVVWRGAWAAGTDYVVDNAVTYNGSSYRVTVAHTPAAGENPAATPGKYAYIAMKGADGAAGAAGANGAAGAAGAAGVGVPIGGTTGKVLAKKTNADYDTEWVAQSGGPKFRGDYGAAVTYSAGDVVKYNSALYEAKTNLAAGVTPVDGASWGKMVTEGGAGGPKYKGDYNAVTAYSAGDIVKYAGSLWEAQSAVAAGTTPSPNPPTVNQGGNHIAGGTNVNFGGGNNEQTFTVNATTVISELEIQLYNGGIAAGNVAEIRNAARDTVLATGIMPAGSSGAWVKTTFSAPVTLVAGTTYVLRVFTGNAGAKANPAVPSGIVSAIGTAYANGGAQGAYSIAFKLNGPIASPWTKMVSESGLWSFMETFDSDLANYTDLLNKSAASIAAGKLTHVASTAGSGLILRRAGIALTDLISVIKVTPPTVASGDLNLALLGRISNDNASWLQGNCNLTGAGTGQLQLYKNVAGTFTLLASQAGITPVAGEDYWVVLRLVGKALKYEWWTSDPRAGLGPAVVVSYTLTAAELAAFPGTGVGIRTFSAANMKYDDHGARAITPDLVF